MSRKLLSRTPRFIVEWSRSFLFLSEGQSPEDLVLLGTLQAYNEMNYFMNLWVGTRCYSGITQFGPLNPASELVLTINPRQVLTCGDEAELSLVGG